MKFLNKKITPTTKMKKMKKIITLMKKLSTIWTLRLSASSQLLISNYTRFLTRCKVNYFRHKFQDKLHKFQIILRMTRCKAKYFWQAPDKFQIIDKISQLDS